MTFSQCCPVEPGGQWQTKPIPLLTQRPWPHGFVLHTSTVFSHLNLV